jgi:hypothetical protein
VLVVWVSPGRSQRRFLEARYSGLAVWEMQADLAPAGVQGQDGVLGLGDDLAGGEDLAP